MAKPGRGRAGSQPELFDVAQSLLAIEEYHQVKCTITVTTVPNNPARLICALSALPMPRQGGAAAPIEQAPIVVMGELHDGGLLSVFSALYRQSLDLDVACSRLNWAQQPLPDLDESHEVTT